MIRDCLITPSGSSVLGDDTLDSAGTERHSRWMRLPVLAWLIPASIAFASCGSTYSVMGGTDDGGGGGSDGGGLADLAQMLPPMICKTPGPLPANGPWFKEVTREMGWAPSANLTPLATAVRAGDLDG